MPPLPLHEAGPYVAAAYIVFFALVLIYVAIMAVRLVRLERRLGELLHRSELSPAAAPEQDAGAANGGHAGDESGPMDVGRPERTPV